jgi:hypothetical protein
MVPAEGSARAAASIGADVEAAMNGLRANDRVGLLPGGSYTHWKAPPFHGAHPKRLLGRLVGCRKAVMPADLSSPNRYPA